MAKLGQQAINFSQKYCWKIFLSNSFTHYSLLITHYSTSARIFSQDARDYQIIFLSLFLFLGISTRDWTLRPDLMVTVTATCLVTQWFFVAFLPFLNKLWKQEKLPTATSLFPLGKLRSALITALGLCLLLRANDYRTMMLAAFLAIASKFLFRYQGKHFFNPANFGIIAAVTFTADAWISPGQWGTDWWYLLLFAGCGGMVLQKVGRWDTSATFFVSYAGLEAIRNFWLGWSWDVLHHQLMSGSLMLFALFMLTDPRSIPNARISRLIWAISIAWVTFILQHQFYISTAIFWALFALSPLTLILDGKWSAPRFQWQHNLSYSGEVHSVKTF